MKKKYQKPMIWIEDFDVSDHIAAGAISCGFKTNSTDSGNCDIQEDFLNNLWDMGLFQAALSCDSNMDETGMPNAEYYNKICYHGAVMQS